MRFPHVTLKTVWWTDDREKGRSQLQRDLSNDLLNLGWKGECMKCLPKTLMLLDTALLSKEKDKPSLVF